MTIGENIKNYRKLNNMTMEELANKIGVTKSTIFKYEKDIIGNIPVDNLYEIAKALDVNVSVLLNWDTPNGVKQEDDLDSQINRLINCWEKLNSSQQSQVLDFVTYLSQQDNKDKQ